MPLFFVQFGAFDAAKFRHAVDTVPIKVAEVSIQVGPLAGNYQQVPRLFEALEMLLQGATLCVSVLGEEGEVRWMLLFAPNAMDSTIPMWHAVLELRSNSHELIFQALKEAQLQYIAVAKDEPFDLQGSNLDPEKFPWNSPDFVAAAIADDKGSYRENPS